MGFQEVILGLAESGALDSMLRRIHRDCAYALEFDDFRQEVVLRAWEHRDRFVGRDDRDLARYLNGIARNLLIDTVRRNTMRARETRQAFAGVDQTAHPRDSALVVDTRDWVRWLVAGLSHEERELLRRRYWMDQTLDEIARAWGRTPRAVIQLHYRAIQKLRNRSAPRTTPPPQ